MATASALSRSGASTEPRYSPLLRMMMTRQLRRLAGFFGLGRVLMKCLTATRSMSALTHIADSSLKAPPTLAVLWSPTQEPENYGGRATGPCLQIPAARHVGQEFQTLRTLGAADE